MFPDLELDPTAEYHASAEGVPDNGNNTIALPFRREIIDPDRLVIDVFSLGSSVTNAELISVDPEAQEMVVNFTQSGVDRARVEAVIRHSATN